MCVCPVLQFTGCVCAGDRLVFIGSFEEESCQEERVEESQSVCSPEAVPVLRQAAQWDNTERLKSHNLGGVKGVRHEVEKDD